MEYSKSFCFYIVIVIVLWNFDKIGCVGTVSPAPFKTIEQGTLEGRTVTTLSGFQYDSYQGIPYARPPLGDLRFRDPYPAGEWKGILNATAPGSACVQFDPLLSNTFYGNEDCLFLNVYVPKTSTESKDLSVMVWFHGGGFTLGDGNPTLFGPDYFVESNIILVTLNYRLGAFGFLSLSTPDVPGNAGMKDQVLALKWVRKNINLFGGNPEKVTIFGESAGAASVQYHMLSTMSKGLFSGAILQSGSNLCPWAFQEDPEAIAQELTRVLSKGEDIKDIGKFLRTIPAQNLTFAAISPNLVGKIKFSFSPTIEKIFPNIDHFITRSPKEIMSSGDFNKVPTITGLNIVEGWIYRHVAFSFPSDLEAINNNNVPSLNKFVPDELKAKCGNKTEKIEAAIERHYFPTKDNLNNNLVDLYSDFGLMRGAMASLNLFAKYSSPAYFYRFSYSGSVNLLKLISDLQYTGASHLDELGYLFDVEFKGINKIPLTIADKLLTKQLLYLWTNFAKFGNPTPQESSTVPLIWPPVKADNSDEHILDIDRQLQLIPNPFAEKLAFWNELLEMQY